jgi:hypothetical protein
VRERGECQGECQAWFDVSVHTVCDSNLSHSLASLKMTTHSFWIFGRQCKNIALWLKLSHKPPLVWSKVYQRGLDARLGGPSWAWAGSAGSREHTLIVSSMLCECWTTCVSGAGEREREQEMTNVHFVSFVCIHSQSLSLLIGP